MPTGTDNVVIDVGSGSRMPILSGLVDPTGSTANITVGGTTAGNTLAILNGGTLVSTGSGVIGDKSSGSGTVTVSGTGSQWSVANGLTAGNNGTGALTIENGGMVVVGGGSGTLVVASGTASTGSVNIGDSSGTATAGSLDASTVAFGSGTGSLNFYQIDTTSFSATITGAGSVNQLGTGTTILTGVNSYTGSTSVNAGVLTIAGGGAVTNTSVVSVGSGSTDNGTLNVGGSGGAGALSTSTLYVGNSGTGSMNIGSGGTVADGVGEIGFNAGSSGTVSVTGGSWSNTAAGLGVGASGTGVLLVSGGTVSDTSGYVGINAGSNGTATVSGSGSWISANDLNVGYGGTGGLSVSGGTVSDATGFIGTGTGGNGTATVSGSGSWITTGALNVGNSGTGTLIVSGGTVSDGVADIGSNAGSSGTANVTGGLWSSTGAGLGVGASGLGVLTVSGGTVSDTSGYIGINAGSNGTATVSGSGNWITANDLNVGYSGTGALNINGGAVSDANGYIGYNGTGSAGVSGGTWSNSAALAVGNSGTGSLTISGSGAVTDADGYVGYNTGGSGTAGITGGTWTSTDSSFGLFVGFVATSTGSLSISGTGAVSDYNGYVGYAGTGTASVSGGTWSNSTALAVGNTGTGSLSISGSGTVTDADGYVGYGNGGSGTANITDGTWISTDSSFGLFVGFAATSTGSLSISGSGTVSDYNGFVGYAGTGSASVSGGTWSNSSAIYVGNTGTGVLSISDGLVSDGDGNIASGSGGTGTVQVSGGTWANSGGVNVGLAGTGTLAISGGSVTDQNGVIGDNLGATGSASVTGGAWTSSAATIVGQGGTGILTVAGGSVLDGTGYIGLLGTGSGTVNVTSGTWTNTAALVVGGSGSGVLNLSGSGVVNVNGGTGTVFVGQNAGSSGTINIGSGTTGGTLQAGIVFGGSGSAAVNFSETGSYVFTPALAGNLTVNQTGSGTTILTANSAYTGSTTISAGGLQLGNGGASGSILGNVTDNGALIFDMSGTYVFAGAITGTGNVLQTGVSGITVLSGTSSYDVTTVRQGLLDIAGNVSGTGIATVGSGSGSVGALLVTGTFNSGRANIGGNLATGTAVVSGPGALWNISGALDVDTGGNGTVNIQNGGEIVDTNGIIGVGTSTSGTVAVNGAGSQWINSGTVIVGDAGAGFLTVTGGASVSDTAGVIAAGRNSPGSALVSGVGSVWTNTASLAVGSTGTGTLVIQNGGLVSDVSGFIDAAAGGVGTVTVNSGTWVNTGTLIVGNTGTGTLIVENGGIVSVAGGTGTINLAINPGVSGTIQIGNGNAAGTLQAAQILGGGGTGTVIFNQTDSSYTFKPLLNGGLGVVQNSSGVTILSGSNSFSGGTKINGGTLQTQNNSALGAGNVTVNAAGTLQPVGTLGISSLTLNSGTLLFTLGATPGPTPITVSGTVDGTGATVNFLATTVQTGVDYNLVSGAATTLSLSNFTLGTLPGYTVTDGITQGMNDSFTFYVVFTLTGGGSYIWNPNGGGTVGVGTNYVGNGTTTTWSPMQNNTVNSLMYNTTSGSSTLTVYNTLTVTSGSFTVVSGTTTVTGGNANANILTPGDFTKGGQGALVIDPMTLNVGGNANVAQGILNIQQSQMLVNGNVNISSGAALNIQQGSLLAAGGSANVSGSFDIQSGGVAALGGSANVSGLLDIQSGGQAAVAGTTMVNSGGTLTVDGALASQQGVVVAQNGYLNGGGFIAGNVTNNGTVLPGDDPATLTIAGNYTQSSGGALNMEVATTGNYSTLVVSGAANPGGKLAVTSFGGFQFAYGQQFANFLISSGVSGSFDSVTVNEPGYRGRVIQNGGDLSLLIAPSSYTAVAKNPNQYNVAKALNSFIPASGDRAVVSTALDSLTASQYPTAFNAIMPDFYQTMTSIGLSLATSEGQIVDQRLSAIRMGSSGFAMQGVGNMPVYNEKGGDGKSTMEGKKDIISPAPDNNWGVWVQGNGIFGHSYSISDVPNYNFESGGFLVGGDYRWNEHFSTGLFTGYQGAYGNYPNGGKVWMNGADFGTYATYDSKNGFHANAILMGAYSNYRVDRSIQFGAIDRTASSTPGGGDLGAFLEAGYDFKTSGFIYGPLANAQYTYLGIAPFTERNAGSLDLSMGQENLNSLQTNLGGHVAYTFILPNKYEIIPDLRMFWNHEFLQNPTGTQASLNGGGGPGFTYDTTTPSRDSVYAGLGINAQLGSRWNVGAYYNIDFGGYTSITHIVSANLGFSW